MSEIERKVAEIFEEMNLSGEAMERRLSLVELTKEERRLLAGNKERLLELIDGLTGEFIERLYALKNEEGGSLSRDQLTGLQKRARGYFESLLDGNYDDAYARTRLEIGVVHQAAQVTQTTYLGAYSWLLSVVLERLGALEDASVTDPHAVMRVFTKAVLFDLGLVLEAFTHADHQALEHMALHDFLTDLPNSNLLRDELEGRIEALSRGGGLNVLFIGIDRFKAVNETLGHSTGDEILREVARRLMKAIEPEDFISRLGGDIFVIVASRSQESSQTSELVDKVGRTLERRFDMDGFAVDVTATIGVAFAREKTVDAATLMRQAEMALYHAKSRQIPATVFDADMKRYSVTQLSIGSDLKRAMAGDELVLFYQPKVDVKDGKAIGAEALIRWIHPIRGFMPPGMFMPLAEQTVLIHKVTDWVLTSAIDQAARWQEAGQELTVSVNLAAANLHNLRLPDRVDELLRRYGLEPGKLMLEITESGLMADPPRALETVRRFRELGVKTSIDDFGTGYSSLEYLKSLPVDEIKVDRVFIFGMSSDERDERIVKATIGLGHSLGLFVVAEGVEDQESWDKLKTLGCDTAQGYFFARPMPAQDLESWLKQRS